jgi:hypothetical protein
LGHGKARSDDKGEFDVKQLYIQPLLISLSVMAALCLAGCQDTNKNGVPDSPATGQQIEHTVNNAEKTVQKGVDTVAPTLEKGARKVVPVIEKTVEKGVALTEDAAITGKVKTALISNKTIQAANIDVTTKNKVVYLQGNVASNAQRVLASKIAHQAAGVGHPIKNALKVMGKAH